MIYDNEYIQSSSNTISPYVDEKEWTNSIHPCDGPTTTTATAEKVTESSTTTTPNQKTKRSCTKRKNDGPERRLPVDFEPSQYTVIIGRGKKIAKTTGNCRLRVLATSFLSQYSKATNNKTMKTRIVNKMVDIIKSACTENDCEAAFVRYCNGRWYEVDDSVAREKCGYTLRDLLADQYESSSKRKVAKKRRQKQEYDQQPSPVSFDQSFEQKPLSEIIQEDVLNNCFNPMPMVSFQTQSQNQYHHQQQQVLRLSFDATMLLNQPLIEDSIASRRSSGCVSSVVSLIDDNIDETMYY